MSGKSSTSSLDTALSIAGILVGVVGTAVTLYTYRESLLTKQQLNVLAKLARLEGGSEESDTSEAPSHSARAASFDRQDYRARNGR